MPPQTESATEEEIDAKDDTDEKEEEAEGCTFGRCCWWCCFIVLLLLVILFVLIPAIAQLLLDAAQLSLGESTVSNIWYSPSEFSATFDLHWKLNIPYITDMKMPTKGKGELTAIGKSMTAAVTLGNPTPSQIRIRPMHISVRGPQFAGYKLIVEQTTSDMIIFPGPTRAHYTQVFARCTDMPHATWVLHDAIASNIAEDITFIFYPDVTVFWILRLRLDFAKTMQCRKVNSPASQTSALQVEAQTRQKDIEQSRTFRRKLRLGRRQALAVQNISAEVATSQKSALTTFNIVCDYVGNANA